MRDQRIAVKSALDHMADMAGKPRMDIVIPPKRKHTPSGKPLERDVIAAVRKLLAVHPNVALAIRQNGGTMLDAQGRPSIRFYDVVRRSCADVTLTDFWGFLKFPSVPYAIECKAPGWKRVSNDREARQEAFIGFILAIGGRGGFVTDVEQVPRILELAHPDVPGA